MQDDEDFSELFCFRRLLNKIFMAELTLEHISKNYKGEKKGHHSLKAIDDVSLTVHDKEFVVIVGPSGCGKSTLLRMIAGLEEISEGTLSIDNRRINDLSPRDRDISMVFQNYALYPHMTVYDNLAFGLKLRHFSKSEIRTQVMQTAGLLEIEDELYRKPKTLSGGQRQRVAIGRAIIRRPKVFLFDEPLSNLDAKLRSQMRIELQKLHREIKATMIYVTHDQTEAMTLGNRIAVLNKGKLMQLDTPMHLYNHPVNQFVAGFIGSPVMNFMKGTIQCQQGRYTFVHGLKDYPFTLNLVIADSLKGYIGKNIQIGIRPEHILICEETNTGIVPDCSLEIVAYENMGNEQIVYLSLGLQSLIVRRLPLENTEAGKTKGIHFLRDKMMYFEENGGKGIGS
jgi:multiple sugar transport system ATP-binding protein